MTTYRDLLTLSIGGYTAYGWSSTHPRSSWLWPEKQEGKVRTRDQYTKADAPKLERDGTNGRHTAKFA